MYVTMVVPGCYAAATIVATKVTQVVSLWIEHTNTSSIHALACLLQFLLEIKQVSTSLLAKYVGDEVE